MAQSLQSLMDARKTKQRFLCWKKTELLLVYFAHSIRNERLGRALIMCVIHRRGLFWIHIDHTA